MQTLDELDLLSRSRGAVKQFGLIAGGNAKGFLIDLEYGFEEVAGLKNVQVKKTGEEDCRFRVTGHFEGSAQDALRAVLRVLEERIAYDPEHAAVAYSVQADAIAVQFLTTAEPVGAATVCVRAVRDVA